MSDNESGGIENATHNTLERKPGHGGDKYPLFLLMYCGLHFLFRRVHYKNVQYKNDEDTINIVLFTELLTIIHLLDFFFNKICSEKWTNYHNTGYL
jgi:hypothetical protein